jgi:hypothetical protein
MTLLGRAILNQPLTLKPLTDSEYFTSMPKDYGTRHRCTRRVLMPVTYDDVTVGSRRRGTSSVSDGTKGTE